MWLSDQADRNQVSGDWRWLLALAPDSCRAGWVEEELVATSTAVTFDREVS